MGKTTPSPSSDPDAVAAAMDVRNDRLRNQVDDISDSVSALENQQTTFQQALDQMKDSNVAFQQTITSQLTAFQSLLLDELRSLQPVLPAPPTTTTPSTTTPPFSVPSSTPTTQPSFRSLFPPQITGLGFSHPPVLTPLPSSFPLTRPTPSPSLTSARPRFSQHFQASSSNFSPHPSTPFSPFSPAFHLAPTPPSTHTQPSPPITYPPNSFHPLPTSVPLSPHPHPNFTPTLPPQTPHFKPIKMDLPRFTGDDPYGWLAMAERYLDYYEVPPNQWVLVAACNFGADASIWMRGFEQRYGRDNWSLFVDLLLQRFGGGDRANIESQLTHIQQKGTVDDYIAEFTKLSCRVIDWTENQLKHVFLGGLRDDIRHDVLALEPDSLHQAQKLAKIFETKNQAKRYTRLSRPFHSSPFSRPPISTTSPLPITSPQPPSHPTQPFKRLNPTEVQDKIRKKNVFIAQSLIPQDTNANTP